jgi:hypothetical protein
LHKIKYFQITRLLLGTILFQFEETLVWLLFRNFLRSWCIRFFIKFAIEFSHRCSWHLCKCQWFHQRFMLTFAQLCSVLFLSQLQTIFLTRFFITRWFLVKNFHLLHVWRTHLPHLIL